MILVFHTRLSQLCFGSGESASLSHSSSLSPLTFLSLQNCPPDLSHLNPRSLPDVDPSSFRSARIFPVASDDRERSLQMRALSWPFGGNGSEKDT